MSEKPKALLLDMGNSQTKYAMVEEATAKLSVHVATSTHCIKTSIKSSDRVLLSSVGNPQHVTDVEALCQRFAKPLQIIKTEAQTFGIECAYQRFQTLGVDRWLAILAARTLSALPLAVIDLGTANTCDFVIGNKHLGGWIAPGFSLMRSSLTTNTQGVFSDQAYPSSLEIGQTTEQCVNMGCIAAMQGFVNAAESELQMQADDYCIIVTGGAKSLLTHSPAEHVLFEDNLVLQGLTRYL